MALTYTRAEDRGRRDRTSDRTRRGHVALTVVALVSLVALTATCAGRIRASAAAEQALAVDLDQPPVDLAARPAPASLERVAALAFERPADQRFAAQEIAAALGGDAGAARSNVASLGRIEVALRSIDRTSGLDVFATRAQQARARAASAGAEPSAAIPLLTTGDIARLKPALVVRTDEAFGKTVFWCVLGLLLSFQGISLVWSLRGIDGDRLLLAAVHLLVTMGALAMLSRPDPLRDTILLVRFTQGVMIAAAVCLAASLIKVRSSALLQLSYLSLACAVLLALVLMLFGTGPGTSGAKVNLGSWQPIEVIRLLLIVFLAGYLGRRWELVRQTRETEWRRTPLPAWVNVPRLEHLTPMLGGVGLALVLFFALRDLGPALLLALLLLLMLSVARAGAGALVIGLVVLVSGFAIGYALDVSSTLSARAAMWRSPWENAIRGGDQLAQAAWALAAGSLTGTGAGLGSTRYLPAGHTDLVLAALAEELGLVAPLVALAAAAVIGWRGLRIARRAPTDATVFLALGLTLSLLVPMLVMAAGTLGLVPLTGVVTPFVSYGGSAMLANFAALGVLVAIGADSREPTDVRPFLRPLRWLQWGLAACAFVIVVAWARVQVVHADDTLVRPQLSRQADGGIRYQYNPRVLDAARTLPRGTIADRRNVPLAADLETVRAAAPELARLRIAPETACPDPAARCYPLGPRAFYLLGDAETRLNWAASNTSFVERDADDSLRGFDDRARTVEWRDEDARPQVALKRDYRDLVPLVRHRWNPDHPDVQALRARTRDVRLTIDARLQVDVSAIVARAVVAAGIRKAAVVVVDAVSGELLASVSYPWPAANAPDAPATGGELVDRARYGLYPPGSTFKLITAAAALGLDPAWSQQSFACVRLPDGRAGARIPGHAPIRDDIRDRQPHGTLHLRDALVHSCNAYFAQLAVRLGSEPIARTAAVAGIDFPTKGPESRLQANLPHAGYGQGDVLATPLRMARVAAAIASDGMIREPSVVVGASDVAPRRLVSTESARLLGGAMRDAVRAGTGRLLRDHPRQIAGKTGTAELDEAPSHAWFVGFAPATPGARRIAFAVILENAGYGGGAAAAVAGQVVTAAASRGHLP